jgi:hypothetical protein
MQMKTTMDANDPRCWDQLSSDRQAALVGWIRDVLVPAGRAFHRSSYAMKHDFEREPGGFYVTNGMFKGAMLAAGHQPVDAREINWRFRVRPGRELDDHEKTRMRVIGCGWLARDSPERSGYAVMKRGDWKRIAAWCQACYREKRPMIRVEVRGHSAVVVMDMIAADWKLSSDAMNEVAQLFFLVDPKGKNWWNINGCYNYIRRVPADVADAVAARLVMIADGCRPPDIPR